ncbi:MAG: cell division protein FtsW [Peptoniphilaceae bacterium]|nr:cell division protein FtsW [Peptoniphilaceae bacterium]MDY6019648.1 cell division protein FtsW [Anaerococcus sp.]
MKVKLSKRGNSQGLRISRSILDALNWKDGDFLDLKIEDNKLIIKNSSFDKISIEDLFKDFEGQYVKEDIDWGESVGHEVW